MNKDKSREYQKRYYVKNREKILQRVKKYHAENREEALRRMSCYGKNNRGKINTRRGRTIKKYYATINGHLRRVFNSMNQRCNNSNHVGFKYYGGRGIENKFESTDEFVGYVINELKVDPRGLHIDRIDNDGCYEKGNIRFVTAAINNGNRRHTIKKM